jgi:hypothetical protein
MAPPAGYSASQMIFDDTFSGTTLDGSKWNTSMGAGGSAWANSNYGVSLPDSTGGSPTQNAMYYAPSQVSVDNGLTLTAQRSSANSNFQWVSGVVDTMGKFTLPTTGWYVQANIKVPDSSQGMWPGMWFLPGGSGSASNELDGLQGGFTDGSVSPNDVNDPDYFANSGQQTTLTNVGFDMSAGYHTYGVQWLPGQSITWYIDGKQVFQVTEAQAGSIVAQGYEIILNLQVATAHDSSWHSAYTASTPTSSMQVAEVQAYS